MTSEWYAMPDVRTELQVHGGKQAYVLIVEPWAEEFTVNPGDRCRVVAVHDSKPASFGIEYSPGYIVVCINEGGSTFEFWRGDNRET